MLRRGFGIHGEKIGEDDQVERAVQYINDNINDDVLNEDLSDNSLVLNEFKPDKININNDLEKHDNILDNSNIVNSDVNIIKNDVEDSVDINDKFLDIDDEVI